MWSTAAIPGLGMQTTALTDDGWTTAQPWGIGNPQVRAFPALGPADVAFADGTVLAAGAQGLILTSVDGTTFFYGEASGVPLTDQWSAVDLADAQHGVVAGAGGRILYTDQADVLPVAVCLNASRSRRLRSQRSTYLDHDVAQTGEGRLVGVSLSTFAECSTLPRNIDATDRMPRDCASQRQSPGAGNGTRRDPQSQVSLLKDHLLSRTKVGRAK